MSALRVGRLSYVRMPCANVQTASRLVADLLGLEYGEASEQQATFRSDERSHTLALTTAGKEAVGIEVADLDVAVERLRRADAPIREASEDECRARSVKRAVLTSDPSGNAIDLVLRPGIAARRFFPPRDAGITGLRAVALRSTRVIADTSFWIDVIGAEISDWVGDITYLRLDDAHHRIALFPSSRPGILYQSYGVADLNALMRSLYYLTDRQVEIVQGPGRETVSGEAFLRWRAAEEMLFSLSTANDLFPIAASGPRQFVASPDALCTWGSQCETVPELDLSVPGQVANARSATL